MVAAMMSCRSLRELANPTEEDKLRIKGCTPNGYLSSGATHSPDMDDAVLKRLKDICTKVTRVNSNFGAIRLRKCISSSTWNVELFGSACQL
ncbi:Metallo-beta-lactamase superfamily protein (fragment) [mine drainage metagenome]|uniref:Metallo-beta-lactamase superfamily protein n=1 Tax=mine drainage metagenome TaxID=410659 RepID=A0A3P3ZQ65_9ZZZZ